MLKVSDMKSSSSLMCGWNRKGGCFPVIECNIARCEFLFTGWSSSRKSPPINKCHMKSSLLMKVCSSAQEDRYS